MPFPFTVKFTKKLKETLSPEDYPTVFTYLSDYLLKKSAMDIVIKKNVLEFNVKYVRPNWHFILPIDGGQFTFTNKNENVILIYKIFLYRAFFVYSVMSLVACGLSKSILLGGGIFLATYGINFLVAVIKHRIRHNKIAIGIGSLIQQKKCP